jgi:hypothetical protein
MPGFWSSPRFRLINYQGLLELCGLDSEVGGFRLAAKDGDFCRLRFDSYFD